MNVSYSIYRIKEQRYGYDYKGPSCFIEVNSNFDTIEKAEKYIKENGYFDYEYTILPIYRVDIDDLEERNNSVELEMAEFAYYGE